MPYLDHAATSPLRPEALEAMTACFGLVGNPSSVHAAGRSARRVVEESRDAIADAVGAAPTELIFTGGGTEADNLAVKGLYWARRAADERRRRVVISPIEHSAVRNSARWLAQTQGAEVVELPVDSAGRVSPDTLADVLAGDPASVALVSVMWANNEVGTLQPVPQLAAVASSYGVPFHTDAVQAVGHLPVDFAASGADALTLTAHKAGGPLGIGALVVRRGLTLQPVQHGGGQERDVRSGTLDAVGAAGFAAAVTTAVREQPAESARLRGLRDALVAGMREAVPDVVLNGPGLGADERLSGNASLSFPGCAADSLLMLLDAAGIACSTGSACSAGVLRPSAVLLALGVPEPLALGALRFTLGATSTAVDVEAAVAAIGPIVATARRVGGGVEAA